MLAEKILLSKLNNLNKVIILRLSSVFGTNILNSSKELIFTLANNFCYQAIKKSHIVVENPSLVRNFFTITNINQFFKFTNKQKF